MPKNFHQDAKDCVVRLVEDWVLAENLTLQKTCRLFAPRFCISWHTAQQWGQRSRREGRVHHLGEKIIVENARIRREIHQLRDTNELLKASSDFSRQQSPRKRLGTKPRTVN